VTPAPEQKAKIDGLIKKLSSEFFEDREAAQKELVGMGNVVIPQLRAVLASDDPEVKNRAEKIMKILEHSPTDEQLMKLASELEAAVVKASGDEDAAKAVRGILEGFATKFAPESGSVNYATKDGKTLSVCLGRPANEEVSGVAAEIKAGTRWVVAIGGVGLDNNLGRLPGNNEDMPDGAGGSAKAEATSGIAVAFAGDGMVIRTAGGIAGGGRGADA
jgi:hypothetical protein